MTEMRNQTLYRPRRCITQSTNRMAFDLLGHFQQHIDFFFLRPAFRHPRQNAPHPTRTFTTRRTLPATLVLVEIGKPRHRPNNIGGFIHHDNGSRTKSGTKF